MKHYTIKTSKSGIGRKSIYAGYLGRKQAIATLEQMPKRLAAHADVIIDETGEIVTSKFVGGTGKQPTGKHGGKRPGAGRKPRSLETRTLAFRVPADVFDELKEKFRKIINRTVSSQ